MFHLIWTEKFCLNSMLLTNIYQATIMFHLIWTEKFCLNSMLLTNSQHLPVLVHSVLFRSHIEASTLFEPSVPPSLLQFEIEVPGHAGNLGFEGGRLKDAHQPSCMPGGSSTQLPLFQHHNIFSPASLCQPVCNC